MKATQYMMDIRLLDAIEALKIYIQLFDETGMVEKAASCRESLDNLKVVAFDTAEIVSVTEVDDPELSSVDTGSAEHIKDYSKPFSWL